MFLIQPLLLSIARLVFVATATGMSPATTALAADIDNSDTRTPAENEIVLRTGNDFLSGNSRSDDLYTAGIGFTLELDRDQPANRPLGRRFVSIEENIFTDREADRRFDETWLLFGRRLRGDAWQADVVVGGVRAGRGLFGEDAQNLVHRLIGDDEVHLRYVERDRHFAVFGARIRSNLLDGPRGVLTARAEARLASEFQNFARVAVDARLRIRPWLDGIASLGARVSHASYGPLRPWIETVALTAELGVLFKDRLEFTWTHNEFGTGLGHINLSARLPLGATLRGAGTNPAVLPGTP